MYVFGGQDIKEGSTNTVWKVDVASIIKQAVDGEKVLKSEW